ncbi:MAG: PqqD family protein [Planctomycetota bacterium]
MNSLNRIIKKNESIAYRVIDEEALLVSPLDNLIYPLNLVATRIWELIDGKRNINEINAVIIEEFDVMPTEVQNDTMSFVEDLLNKKLVFICIETTDKH